jgi:hypothetical protein
MPLAAVKASRGASRTIISQIGIESRAKIKPLAYRLFMLAEVGADIPAVTILTRGWRLGGSRRLPIEGLCAARQRNVADRYSVASYHGLGARRERR